MTFSNFSKREKAVLSITVSLIFVFLIYNFAIQPITAKFEALKKKILINERKLKKNLSVLGQKDMVESEYLKYSQLLKQKDSDEQEMSALLSDIESIAQEVAIRVTNMKPKGVKSVNFYKRLSVDIEVEAELNEITKFIYNLQKEPHLLSVDNLRLKQKRRHRSSVLRGYLLVTKDLIP